MSDAAAPATPAPAAPTPAPADAPAAPQTPATAPAVDPSTAGKALRAAQSYDALKAKAKAASAPAPGAAAEPAKPAAAAKVDPDVEAVERILREDARSKAERKAAQADREAAAAERAAARVEVDAARAARDARAKGDAIGALKALGFTEADIYEGDESIVFKLAESRALKPQLDERARLEAVVADKLAEKEAAEKADGEAKAKAAADEAEKAKAAAEANVTSAREAYAKNVIQSVSAAPDKYPSLLALEIPARVVVDYAWQTIVNSRGETVLTEEQALADLEAHYAARARKAAGIADDKPKAAPAPHVPITVNPSWQATSGTPARPVATTLKDKEAALRDRARKAAAG